MSRAFDYKKEYKDLYFPGSAPMLITVPPLQFIAVAGSGDPNSEEFQKAVGLLYGLSFTIKMSKMKGDQPEGYFEYVVPPLEGLWWIDGDGFSFAERDNWRWEAMIRQPEFVDDTVFAWACEQYAKKEKAADLSRVAFKTFEEGLCVQIMHIGPYATEPETVARMESFMAEKGLINTFTEGGKHHEIYLGDPRKAAPEKLKTVLRHPVKYAKT